MNPSLRIDDPAAARALRQDHDFLSLFVEPKSPSEIASAAGMAPNLAHHHVTRLLKLGLLAEVKREGGRVYYQLSAQEFRVPSLLLPPDEAGGNGSSDMQHLSTGFLRAYERAWRDLHEDEEDVYGFGSGKRLAPPLKPNPKPSSAPYPPHHQSLTLRLSPARYRQLIQAMSEVLVAAYAEGHTENGQHCTVALTAFCSDQGEQGNRLSMLLNSFLADAEQINAPY